ncbi:bacitracin resistance protein BacA [Leptospira interrogans]|uniref:Bacterial globin-like protein n=7 Tax=Leptospira interrogans TaxID=173 RepID=Q8EZ80_LEPIN|nr:bacitracin resistance protein BacA [Leptospira interrogans]EMG09560.1 globin, protozoan/cyanobacterial family [Leptospira interrogans serovar Grippotyphosa str. LT2186]EMM80049.1 globin, protozoan/cyanobacterial family [Leptospira interrogans str. 2006001854]EMM95656.1 globin, protozoan/cyanobacterial family [Leptospira interrogans serovar Zanoni str. LT2156]AAN51174.1 bacterial globin-like protein [Leptospira interrogans serovar Lai str. 56601]AER03943.1 bacterial globin-like protein [Lept
MSFFIPPGGPPGPIPGLQLVFGSVGENSLRKLVSDFYDQIPSSSISFMFPENLEDSKIKSADFLIQVTGGPPLYSQNYGPPKMRARHLPFPIDEKARRVWLSCYRKVLDDWDAEVSAKEVLWIFFKDFSTWMVNLESKTEESNGI